MEIVSIEKKTFEEMKERFDCFSQHVRELCARYRRGLLPYSQINHKIYYRTEDVEAFVEAMSREMTEDE